MNIKQVQLKQGEKMKKLLFFTAIMGLIGCDTYTVKNNSSENIKAGDQKIAADHCEDYYDSFFGLFGNYPIPITKEDGSALFEDAEEEYHAANYIVTDTSITEVKEKCDPKENPSNEQTGGKQTGGKQNGDQQNNGQQNDGQQNGDQQNGDQQNADQPTGGQQNSGQQSIGT